MASSLRGMLEAKRGLLERQFAAMETAIPTTGDNLDTDAAAVWKHNPREQRDRDALFESWRRRMCGFIGIPPGPALGDGGISVCRA